MCPDQGRHVAAATRCSHVLLYGNITTKRGTKRWEFIGKCAAHSAEIVGLHFGESPSGKTRLFSIGSDNQLVEYAVEESSVQTGALILEVMKACAASSPTAMAFGPPQTYYSKGSTETTLIVAGEECFHS